MLSYGISGFYRSSLLNIIPEQRIYCTKVKYSFVIKTEEKKSKIIHMASKKQRTKEMNMFAYADCLKHIHKYR